MKMDAAEELFHILENRHIGAYASLVPQPNWDTVRLNVAETIEELNNGSYGSYRAAWDVFATVWPNDNLSTISPEWWRTELGKLVAKVFVDNDQLRGRFVTQAVAAKILGKAPGTVARLVYSRNLQTDENGKIYLTSVLRRLLRLASADAAA